MYSDSNSCTLERQFFVLVMTVCNVLSNCVLLPPLLAHGVLLFTVGNYMLYICLSQSYSCLPVGKNAYNTYFANKYICSYFSIQLCNEISKMNKCACVCV